MCSGHFSIHVGCGIDVPGSILLGLLSILLGLLRVHNVHLHTQDIAGRGTIDVVEHVLIS